MGILMIDTSGVWQDGYDAYLNGEALTDNPHDVEVDELLYIRWFNGFETATQDADSAHHTKWRSFA